ncbi:TPA: hypothetical protein RTG63_001713 [Campylobacter jejuni]|nr:hypothetical protein [Campylobacter jejuni]
MKKQKNSIKILQEDLKQLENDSLLNNASPSFIQKVLTKINVFCNSFYKKQLQNNSRYFNNKFRKNFLFKKKEIATMHVGLSTYKLSDLNLDFKKQYKSQLVYSLSLIKSQNEENLNKLKNRFYDWVNLKTVGDDKVKLQSLTKLPRSDKKIRFILKDQTNKLSASMDGLVADRYNPIAFQWKTRNDNKVVGKPGGKYPGKGVPGIHGDHWARKDQYYYYEKNENVKFLNINKFKGKASDIKDGMPGIPIGCRCYAKFIYTLEDLPKDLVKLEK